MDESVDMSESEFRNLLKSMFTDIPSYHLNSIVRLVRLDGKKRRIDIISDRLGGFI